jgi:hypothetical protein
MQGSGRPLPGQDRKRPAAGDGTQMHAGAEKRPLYAPRGLPGQMATAVAEPAAAAMAAEGLHVYTTAPPAATVAAASAEAGGSAALPVNAAVAIGLQLVASGGAGGGVEGFREARKYIMRLLSQVQVRGRGWGLPVAAGLCLCSDTDDLHGPGHYLCC